jgi:hypothetical protein
MVKSRHKILMPTLVLNITKTKLKQAGGYRSSFGRNLHERTDEPVFTIEDAVRQLKTNDPNRSVKVAGDYDNNELDEDAIRRQMRSGAPRRRHSTENQQSNDSQESSRMESVDGRNFKLKRGKSDLTGAFMDSSEQVAKLAQKSEIGQNIDRMRKLAKSNRRGSVVAPQSKFKPETLER